LPDLAGARGTTDCGRPDLRGRNRSVARQRAVRGRPEAGRGVVRVSVPRAEREGTSRKISYVLAVPGTPYVVGAGVYDEEITLDELEAVSGRQ
jgi:hypothetical protein